MQEESTANDPSIQPAGADALSYLFEDHLFRLISSSLELEDAKQAEKLRQNVRSAIKARLEVVVAGKEFVKLMLSGNAAAFVLLIGFIYEHKAVAIESILVKILVVISAASLLFALFLTFGQFARLSAQEQIQRWRIALAEAGNWQGLVATWSEARQNLTAKRLVSAETTNALEMLILFLWAAGAVAIVMAWVLSYF